MGRLITVSLLLITIFALVIGALLTITQAQTFPARVERLHLSECALPCWNGITPGASTPDEATDRINTSLPELSGRSANADSQFLTWTETDDLNRIVSVVDVTFENGRVATIGIGTDHVSNEMPRLSEVLAVYGAPTCIEIDDVTDHSYWFYENADHHFMLQFSTLLSLASPVNNFVFGDSGSETCQSILALPWQDFRYMEPAFLAAS